MDDTTNPPVKSTIKEAMPLNHVDFIKEKYMPHVLSTIDQMTNSRKPQLHNEIDQNRLIQAGFVGAVRAFHTHNPDKDMELDSFVKMNIRNALRNENDQYLKESGIRTNQMKNANRQADKKAAPTAAPVKYYKPDASGKLTESPMPPKPKA